MGKSEAVKRKNQHNNQSVKPRGKTVKQRIANNVLVLAGICVLAVLFLRVIGHFTELHPDAYQDLIRSIVFGYGIYLLIYGLYHGVYEKIFLSKGKKEISPSKESRRIASASRKETPLEAVCVTFSVITAINSLMMLTGIDTPKEGTFAYVHMLVRVMIITGIIGIWMGKDLPGIAKNFRFKSRLKNFYHNAHRRVFRSAAIVFTLFTVVFCLAVIALQSIINPAGGPFFYQTLLAMLGLITLGMFVLRIRRTMLKKENQLE